MKIGVRAHDYGRHGVADYAALLKKEGYEAVQLAIPKAFTGIEGYGDITEELCEQIREEFAKQEIEIAVLGCYMDLGNPDAEVRAHRRCRPLKTVCTTIRLSARVSWEVKLRIRIYRNWRNTAGFLI